MLRRLFTLTSAVSLVLCVTSCALWARSRDRMDRLTTVSRHGTFVNRGSRDGKAYLAVAKRWPDDCGGYYTCATADWVGPAYTCTDAMVSELRAAGGYLIRGGFSVPTTTTGKTVVQEAGEPDEEMFGRATAWPVCPGFELCVPWPALAAALAVPTVARLAGRARGCRRARHGLCRSCGYDLRATPERCPECGAVPSAVKTRGQTIIG